MKPCTNCASASKRNRPDAALEIFAAVYPPTHSGPDGAMCGDPGWSWIAAGGLWRSAFIGFVASDLGRCPARARQLRGQVADGRIDPVVGIRPGRPENGGAVGRRRVGRSRVRLLTTSHRPRTACDKTWTVACSSASETTSEGPLKPSRSFTITSSDGHSLVRSRTPAKAVDSVVDLVRRGHWTRATKVSLKIRLSDHDFLAFGDRSR